MTLSICIPIYNFDVRALVNELLHQIKTADLDAEVILIDDASASESVRCNLEIESRVACFIRLKQNIGRSKIRNMFLNYSQSEYLLFLDCDGKIISSDFVQNYVTFIKKNQPDVVYGGREVSLNPPSLATKLRWKFATERENLSVEQRLQLPYLSFQTNNFVVKRAVMEKVPFEERITQYGYEDLIFSKELKDHNIKIDHIRNPILNDDVEDNLIFVEKADQSAKSLAQLLKHQKTREKVTDIKLAKAYFILKKTGLVFIYHAFYEALKTSLIKRLSSGKASLALLDFYKLGQLIGYMKKPT